MGSLGATMSSGGEPCCAILVDAIFESLGLVLSHFGLVQFAALYMSKPSAVETFVITMSFCGVLHFCRLRNLTGSSLCGLYLLVRQKLLLFMLVVASHFRLPSIGRRDQLLPAPLVSPSGNTEGLRGVVHGLAHYGFLE